jgi:hypothetical protein
LITANRRGSSRTVPFYDLKNSIFAEPQFSADQAVAPSRSNKRKHFRSQPIGFRPLPGLAAKTLVTRLCGGNAGADALLDQFALKFGQN